MNRIWIEPVLTNCINRYANRLRFMRTPICYQNTRCIYKRISFSKYFNRKSGFFFGPLIHVCWILTDCFAVCHPGTDMWTEKTDRISQWQAVNIRKKKYGIDWFCVVAAVALRIEEYTDQLTLKRFRSFDHLYHYHYYCIIIIL